MSTGLSISSINTAGTVDSFGAGMAEQDQSRQELEYDGNGSVVFDGIAHLPYRYDEARREWLPQRMQERTAVEDEMLRSGQICLVSQNVWFSHNARDERAKELVRQLRALSPDIVCLQEVTRDFMQVVLADPWVQETFWVTDPWCLQFDAASSYGLCCLSRFRLNDLQSHRMPTRMGRYCQRLEFKLRGTSLVVVTSHLESKGMGAPHRQMQLEYINALGQSVGDNADFVLCGDLNFDGNSQDPLNAKLIETGSMDVWATLRPDDKGFTKDTSRNATLFESAGIDKHERLDRIVLKPLGLFPLRIDQVGTDPFVAEDGREHFISDHFGLVAHLKMVMGGLSLQR